ncbi:kinesin-domain-containing protein [Lichtheimia hyalospora FSU 10163]|nr:kinesin-domain-containing protein [Lichtheimia hyalospora FSU 10163]
MSGGGNIKVVVRCRPLNSRELSRGASCLVRMDGNQTILKKPEELKASSKDTDDTKAFTFDHSYWSADKNDPTYADQERVFQDLGVDLLDHAFDGYNCCIFAYGQTGSGKSYSMMGYGEDKGITPRTCCELFERINKLNDDNLTCRVEVSYIEIYNEKVRDLLNPKNKGNLKVREHPSMGPYVEDLSKMAVNSFDEINHLMDEGNKARTVAATNMNATSSRSHGVFTLILTQKRKDEQTKLETEKVARISLVDLAGSERANSTGATGDRLKEGANINRSLTTLGKVIAGLAEQSMQESGAKKGRKKEVFIPYRDSVLTWLLKDSLGGNSKTAMIAAISPADYDETLSTLRYADQAKKIKNKAVVNEDPNAKIIRELKEELDLLRNRLHVYAPDVAEQLIAQSTYKEIEVADSNGQVRKMTKKAIVEQLQTSEKLLANLNESWEDKLKKTEEIHTEREKALEELGIAVHKNNVGVYTPKKIPHLVNLSEDPLMSECLVYQLKPGKTHVGNESSESTAEIRLSGPNIQDMHCIFENDNGNVTLIPNDGSLIMVNGMRIDEARRLKSGFRIILGDRHYFRFNHPDEVRRERDRQKSMILSCGTNSNGPPTPGIAVEEPWPGSPIGDNYTLYSEPNEINYKFDSPATISGLTDDELDRLYGGISKERNSRRSRPVSRATIACDDDDGSSKDSIRNSMATTTIVDLESVCTDATAINSAEVEERMKAEREKLQKVLEEQKQFYETRINRMSMQLTQPSSDQPYFEYTEAERAWAMKAFTNWKGLRRVAMAEAILTHAVELKEANIISKQFGKDTVYQFTVIENGQFATPSSCLETTSSALHDIQEDDDPELMECPKPCIGVRVIDRKHQTLHVWSLAKLKARLKKMRDLQNVMDRPMYRKHLNWEDPFYQSDPKKYHLIGSAAASVRNLVHQQSYESCVSIVCRSTGQIKGKLRVLISPMIRASQTHNEDMSTLEPGQQMVFEVRLLELTGINEEEFTQVHVQFRLSSFGSIPAHSTADKIFATDPHSNFATAPIQLDYSQTLSVTATENMLNVLTNDMVSFEIYGKIQPRALRQYERWDEQREGGTMTRLPSRSNSRCTDHLVYDPSGGFERRPEEELLAAERHDVVARVQVCELMANGKYVPVQISAQNELDRGVFVLRQGLQRRIQITLSHTSGRQLLWTSMKNATLGRPRFLDGKGRIIDPPNGGDVSIKLGHQSVVYHQDGTSELSAYASWDSSQHECPFLNCITTTNCRIILELSWQVEAEKCDKPMQFKTDIAVQIQGRTSSAFRKLLGQSKSSRVLANYNSIFMVHLRPPMTRRVSQLWRLNTAGKYVRGEELLVNDPWRPRGVSLVNDFVSTQRKIHRLEEVARTAQALTLKAARSQTSNRSMSLVSNNEDENKEKLLRKTLDLWMLKDKQDLVISQEPPAQQQSSTEEQQQQQTTQQPDAKLIAEVTLMAKTGNITKKGYMTFQESALDNKWVKRWFVIRRPYIYIYTNRSETDEQGVINVSSVRIDYNRNLEKMLNRNNVFSLYTTNNAYTLQASSKSDLADWITKIDQLFPLAKLHSDESI